MGGPSAEEKELQREQAAQTKAYIAQQNTVFSESQDLLKILQPMLEKEIANPAGFTPQELADLNASNINTTGAQYANVQKQLNLANASNNMAGLESGVAAGEKASLMGEAAGTVASNAANTQIANAQLAQQNKQLAQQDLMSLQSGQGGQALSLGQIQTNSNQTAFNEAKTIQQQSTGLLGGILGGLVNTGLSLATGGLSNLAKGGGNGPGSQSSLLDYNA